MSAPGSRPVLRLRGSGTLALAIVAQLAWAACSGPPAPASDAGLPAQLPTTLVTLPNSALIEAELAVTPEEQARGLMFRTGLAPDRGMLFVGQRSEPRPFWMYQCQIALDMIWMDGAHRIVEIVRSATPCRASEPSNCPSYGGRTNSVYVLEIAAGQAAAHGLRLGDRLDF